MSQRQQIGLRKTHTAVHKRGMERRESLLQAAYDLLCEREIEDVSFRDIAARAGVPEGSAYHFYANRFDLFTALANDLSQLFVLAHQRKVPLAQRRTWRDLAAYLVDVGARVYAKYPPARALLIGGKTPPEVKQADRMNDREVGELMYAVFSRYFEIPDTPAVHAAFYYFIEITDLMFMISVIENGAITEQMLSEAKRAGTGYLASYLEGVKPKPKA